MNSRRNTRERIKLIRTRFKDRTYGGSEISKRNIVCRKKEKKTEKEMVGCDCERYEERWRMREIEWNGS